MSFTIKDMSDLLYTLLSEIKDDGYNNTECVLSNPTTKSKFPCRVISTPLESVSSSINAEPIVTNYQVSIEHWSESQHECMNMASHTDLQLKEKNFICTNTSKIWLDETTKKYILRKTYENRYYSVNDSFEIIR